MPSMRSESDSLGVIEVPEDRLYGAQTARAIRNFPVSGRSIATLPTLISALAMVKIAAARANASVGDLSWARAEGIIAAARRSSPESIWRSSRLTSFRAAREHPPT